MNIISEIMVGSTILAFVALFVSGLFSSDKILDEINGISSN